jgi:hypothetical protein
MQEPCRCAKTREATRDNGLFSILVRPKRDSVKVIAHLVKTSDGSSSGADDVKVSDVRGDPQSISAGWRTRRMNWKTNALVPPGSKGVRLKIWTV